MDYLSSMYIDNEMDLDEKRSFLERVRSDDAFYKETVELLVQEQLLRELPVMPREKAAATPWRTPVRTVLASCFKPLGFATAGFTAAVLMLFTVFQTPPPAVCNNRFVLFEPAAGQVELAGSFTGWQRVSMTRAGTSGYWEINLQVPSGEHRFAYILDGNRQMADPTLPASEKDDFGGKNSILKVEKRL
ncbi:hypothetical protein DSCA_22350 [Desulfosarcina alkanivorans]|uniref:AMP-activated protein kinase glycogen-binding domain-containing protein n=1 Tax=Desulfosarcina alkanivorans TaxID=571177 RepID=A0A5K7YIU1_9BACT|nr:glycogen-binding domain-containing protein [Desulfosarcina alkanivorans]BBO68305.1 hypothetical protein DSCA_22350 [Desulfosarcina alkanivorans]